MTAAPPSPWVRRWSHLVAPGGQVLDVACGSGRHVRWFAGRGHRVTALDRDEAALAPLRAVATTVVADIEANPWPLPGLTFDAIVVTNYLWRPLMPVLVESLAVGGVLIWETFSEGQQTVGRPANPDFLLRAGELLDAAHGLHVVGYENGWLDEPPRFVQRLAAVHARFSASQPVRYPLLAAPSSPSDPEGE